MRAWPILAVAGALLASAAPAAARPVSAGRDGRPNILVVMTDDQAAADLAQLPSVAKLLVKQGTSFTNAVDSFPLCCPSRATFITGQYAHNHGVLGNFYPYGWYGMKGRANTLPAWLRGAGYRTALIGKWLNGYGALDAHGEVPKGFDIWRGLLDVSAYDYFNFEMNRNGKLKTWGDAVFARGLVEFANIEVTPNPAGLQGVIDKLQEVFGPAPYSYWGTHKAADYSPDVTGKVTEQLVSGERNSKKPFFIWWAPAAPHREDVATTLMGRPGRDPRPAPRYAGRSSAFKLPRPRSFNEADFSDKPSNMRDHAPSLSASQVSQLQLDYEGRIGSLLAVDDHVKRLMQILAKTHQDENTLVVFVSDNGWLQGQHRIPRDQVLPCDESLLVPLVLRGPGIPKGRTVRGQVTNIDFAATLLDVARAKAGRGAGAGWRVAHADGARPEAPPEPDRRDRGAAPAVRAGRAGERVGPAVQGRSHRALHVRALHRGGRRGAVRPQARPRRAPEPRERSGLREDQGAARSEAGEARQVPREVMPH